jgi:hypothetical protein
MVPENLLLEQDRSQRDEPDVLSVRADSLLFAPGSEKQFIYWIDEGKIELHWSMQGSDSAGDGGRLRLPAASSAIGGILKPHLRLKCV